MKCRHHLEGFTLLEMIIVIVILAIIGLFGGLFLINMLRSYQIADDNAQLAQQAQIALTRIAAEATLNEGKGFKLYADDHKIEYEVDEVIYEITYNQTTQRLVVTNKNSSTTYPLAEKVTNFVICLNQLSCAPGSVSVSGIFTVELTVQGEQRAPQTFSHTMLLPSNP